MLYLTAARAGQLWRVDPATRSGELLADGFPGLASLAFGRGKFDADSLYVVQIRGGRLLRFPVAAPRAPDGESAPSPCESEPVFAALDFWVGDWEVFVGAQKVGDDRVAKTLNGCAITESWAASNGGQGFSLFFVDPAESRWKQAWVTGRALAPGGVKDKRLIETLPGGGLRFQGAVRDTSGREWLDRTTLVPLRDGTVQQQIQVSKDDGVSWETTFDAVYRRRPDA
jgi:hypothetical protein